MQWTATIYGYTPFTSDYQYTTNDQTLYKIVTKTGANAIVPDLSYTYLYDDNKNVMSETHDTGANLSGWSVNASGGYDANDRLRKWQRGTAPEVDWQLDKIGNIENIKEEGGVTTETRGHNDVHELTSIDSTGITWDSRGNLKTGLLPGTLYWDIDGHLRNIQNGPNYTEQYQYDALGRRAAKINGPAGQETKTVFVSSGQRVLAEYVGSTIQRKYLYSTYVDDVLCKFEGTGTGTVHYYHRDRQYNVRGLSDSTGVVELYTYSPYGEQQIFDASGNARAVTAHNNYYGFTGRYKDAETGFWYFRARYYSDEMSRFISRDPLGYVDGQSVYAGYFAFGFGMDPSGLSRIGGGWGVISTPGTLLPNGERAGEPTPLRNPIGMLEAVLVALAYEDPLSRKMVRHYGLGGGQTLNLNIDEVEKLASGINVMDTLSPLVREMSKSGKDEKKY